MDQKRLDNIRARCGKATPGPWKRLSNNEVIYVNSQGFGVRITCTFGGEPQDYYNAELVTHAREDIPWLLDGVERLEGLVRESIGNTDKAQELCAEYGEFVGELRAKITALRRERDAVFLDLSIAAPCDCCKHLGEDSCALDVYPNKCIKELHWKWRGPQGRKNHE